MTQGAEAFTRALHDLQTAARGTPVVASALSAFAAARADTAQRVGAHLRAVSTVGVVALAAVDEADAQMAANTDRTYG